MKPQNLWDASFLNQIIDTMADGLFTMNTSGKIISWNSAMERISGYRADEALGKNCGLLQCSRCFGKSCPADINRCGVLKNGKTDPKECFIRHRDGRDIPVIKTARAIKDEDGRVVGVVESLADLTELNNARKKVEEAERRLGEAYRLGNIIGKSRKMQDVFEAIRAAADSRANILIQGESGTGKELVAMAIHYNGFNSDAPLVTVNCSALSETLLESELFGHIKGAFTGAHKDRMGRFEEAHHGTIFLDEIGEITPYIQVKLLRVLQEREVERVGESKKRKIDIRIIAATHQNLMDLTSMGKFREDLFYRLKVFPITIPPLRERREDIPFLVRHFIDKGNKRDDRKIKEVTPEGMRRLMEYPWPGNIRELENAIEHAFVLCRADEIVPKDLPVEIRHYSSRLQGSETIPVTAPVKRLTRDTLVELLNQCDWNKAEVARRIDKSRTAVWKYMKKWDIPLRNE
jgi:PAS domain S-box-containing protein